MQNCTVLMDNLQKWQNLALEGLSLLNYSVFHLETSFRYALQTSVGDGSVASADTELCTKSSRLGTWYPSLVSSVDDLGAALAALSVSSWETRLSFLRRWPVFHTEMAKVQERSEWVGFFKEYPSIKRAGIRASNIHASAGSKVNVKHRLCCSEWP